MIRAPLLGRLELLALAILALSRVWIAYGWDPYISDLLVYHHSALASLAPGALPYRDAFFPYPPAALLFTMLPATFGRDFESYRAVYHSVFLLIEAGVVYGLWLSARDTWGLTSRKRALWLGFYAVLGVLQGRLLYERLDLLMTLAVVLSLVAFDRRRPLWTAAVWNFFFLVKLLPLFWAPWTEAFDSAHRASSKLPPWIESGLRVFLRFAPSAFTLLAFAHLSDGALITSLGDHGERSVQIESTWASLLFLPKLLGTGPVEVIHKWGALHISPASIPPIVDFCSRYLGWMLLATAFAWLYSKGLGQLRKLDEASARQLHALGLVSILLWLVVSQRVLSPQFLIWIAAPISLLAVARRSWALALLAFVAYGATFWGFDFRYGEMVRGEPFTIGIFFVRNLALVGIAILVISDLARSLAPASEASVTPGRARARGRVRGA